MEHDVVYHFHAAIRKLTKVIVERGLPGVVRNILMYAKGIPIGKRKDGIPDADIRPIIVCDSIIRLIDKFAMENIPDDVRRMIIGPTQMIGKKQACEIATTGLDAALHVIKDNNNLAILNLDAANAFNSVSRKKLYELVIQQYPTYKIIIASCMLCHILWILTTSID